MRIASYAGLMGNMQKVKFHNLLGVWNERFDMQSTAKLYANMKF